MHTLFSSKGLFIAAIESETDHEDTKQQATERMLEISIHLSNYPYRQTLQTSRQRDKQVD